MRRIAVLTLILCSAVLAGADQPRQGFIQVEGARLFYAEEGKGPAVVLIHGGMLNHHAWDPQVRALARHFRVVLYDAAGHGQSDVPSTSWKTYEHLRALLDHLGIPHAALVGHSMGARIAVDLAIAHPEMVDALVLVGPGMSGFPFTGRDWGINSGGLARAMRAKDSERAVDFFMRSWVAGPHRTPPQVDRRVWAKVREMALPNAGRFAQGEELDPPAVGRLGEVKAPTLVVEGELDCEDIHLVGRWVERQVPGTRRVVIPGVAHLPGMEDPERFNQLLVGFLRSPKAAGVAPRAGVEEAFVEVPGGRLWADRRGEGEAVLLVHDGIVHSPLWDEVAPSLATQYEVIRFDRRGYGRSTAPTAPYSSLADIEAVLRRFGVEKANLVGSSAGSGLCIDFALAHPEQVLSLTLVGPVVSGFESTRHLMDRGGRLTNAIFGDPDQFRRYWTTGDPFYLAPENVAARQRVAALLEASPQNLRPSERDFEEHPAPALGRLGQIRVPTLIVVGEADIPDVHAHAGVIQAGVPGARRVVVPHSGHGVPLERPEELVSAVLPHLQNRAFLTVLDTQGPAAASALLRDARRVSPAAVLVDEEVLNSRGYAHLGAGRTGEAIAVFRLAVEAFPASANAHDSLGEALLAAGDRPGALASYRAALEIDPAMESARKAVADLEAALPR